MSLESILGRIENEVFIQRDRIIQEAREEAEKIIQQAKMDAEKLYKEILYKERALYEHQRQKLIVNTRLEAKKNLLAAKQELIDAVFIKLKSAFKKEKFKKQQIFQHKINEVSEDIDFYLNKIRPDYETEIAKILFG